MDSSSRLEAILGQLRVDASEITPEEWLQVVTDVLEQHKPHLKYLRGFRPLKEEFNCATGNSGYDYRRTNMEVVEFPVEIDADTKCLWVAKISHEVEGKNQWGENHGCRFVQQKDLYLTTKGEFLLSDHKYERIVRDGLGYRSHRTGIDDVAVWWKFALLADDSLRSVLKPEVGCTILDVLIKYGEESVQERRRHLRAVEEAVLYIHTVRRRINGVRLIG